MNLFGVAVALIVYAGLTLLQHALAAETLTAVSPPTDWTGIGVAVLLAVLVVAILLYVQYLKRPGMQFGEEELEKLANLLHKKTQTNPPPAPLVYDGKTFVDQTALDTYKFFKGK